MFQFTYELPDYYYIFLLVHFDNIPIVSTFHRINIYTIYLAIFISKSLDSRNTLIFKLYIDIF